MGSFVDIDKNVIALDDMHDQIDTTISYTRTYANEMRQQLEVALTELKDLVGTYNPEIDNIDTSIDAIDKPTFPTKPILPDYESTCVLDNLVTLICRNLIEGGTGLTELVYTAIVAREQETRRLNQEREYRNSLDGVGSQGFNLPSGHVASVQVELYNERLSKDQDALNNLQIKDFDLATENTRFMITSGIELEKLLQASWDSAAGRTVDIYKAEISGIAEEYKALVSWVDAEVKRITMEVTLAIENGRLGFDAYNASAILAERVAEAIANIASQSIASALGAINTSLSNSYTGTESRREAWDHSESLRESHSFEEE